MEHFYRKKELTKTDISQQNVHFGYSSNFTKINFNIWTTSSISKTRGILRRFKMAARLKMAVKKWFFGHNSVNIKYFYDLSFAICKQGFKTPEVFSEQESRARSPCFFRRSEWCK
jgi:hypothetical protein